MKNKIIYGVAGSGKTENHFKPEITKWRGKTIAISFGINKIDGFNMFHLDNLQLSFDEIFSYDKIFFVANSNSDFSFNAKSIENIVAYLIENVEKINQPILLAIDDFSEFDLSKKTNNSETLLLNLLKSDRISTLLILQELTQIKELYKNEYKDIIRLSDVICTKEYEHYSGELRVRFPKSLHKYLKEEADKEGISLNQYIVYELTKSIR